MEKIPTVTRRIHPLIAGAAISVTVLSLVGTAAIAGWLPSSKAKGDVTPAAQQNDALAAAQAQQAVQQPYPQDQLQPGQYQPGQQQAQAQVQPEPAPAPVHRVQHHRSTQLAQADQVEHRQPAAPAPAPAPSSPNYVGIGAGALIGGLLGNQVGGGRGRTAATIAGAIGGGMLGNQVQEQQKQR